MLNRKRQAFDEIVEQARNLIEANERRDPQHVELTLDEKQELAVLWVRMDDFRDEGLLTATPSRGLYPS